MSEKEIDKPKRKKEISKPKEKTATRKTAEAKKTAKTEKKTAEKPVELKDSEIDAGSDTPAKPAKKAAKTEKSFIESAIEFISETIFPKNADEEVIAEDSPAETKPVKKASPVKKKIVEADKKVKVDKKKIVKKPVSSAKKTARKSLAVAAQKSEAEKEPLPEISNEALPEFPTKPEVQTKKEESPVFKQLAEPHLPALSRDEDRARLQIQSPNRIFFYWSIKQNPFETLHLALGAHAGNYALIAKLVNLTDQVEEIVPVESHGSRWFDVDSNKTYRAEIGFFASARPFVRLIFSNTVETPRGSPSVNRDWSVNFVVSAQEFAEVLDVSGYAQDAFEVALAGDDTEVSQTATRNAFSQLIGDGEKFDLPKGSADELRRALLALAAGAQLESLREEISRNLYLQLEAVKKENSETLSADKVLSALRENFGLTMEYEEAQFLAGAVFGASSINFPKRLRQPRFSPVSSFRFAGNFR